MQQYIIEVKPLGHEDEEWRPTANFEGGIIEAHMPMDAAAAYYASDGALQEEIRVSEVPVEPRSWIMEPSIEITAQEVTCTE